MPLKSRIRKSLTDLPDHSCGALCPDLASAGAGYIRWIVKSTLQHASLSTETGKNCRVIFQATRKLFRAVLFKRRRQQFRNLKRVPLLNVTAMHHPHGLAILKQRNRG